MPRDRSRSPGTTRRASPARRDSDRKRARPEKDVADSKRPRREDDRQSRRSRSPDPPRAAREARDPTGRPGKEGGPEARTKADLAAPVQPAAAPKLPGKAGGVYMPPFKLAQLMAAEAAKDRTGEQFQRLTWDALRKSINSLVNKVTQANIKSIVQELFNENLIRGKGLLCRSLIRSQIASTSFTPVFASLVAVINSKLPDVGALLITRLLLQFKRSLRRNDRSICVPATIFLAHLVNQQVVDEYVAFEVLATLMLEPSDDSIEITVNFLKQAGAHLEDTARDLLHATCEELRVINSEGQVDQRTSYLMEELFRIRRQGFALAGFVALPPELDLLEVNDRITHKIDLDSPDLKAQTELDIFRPDPDFDKHQEQWQAMKQEILGEGGSDAEEDAGVGGGEDDGNASDSDSGESDQDAAALEIQDQTETNVINLRRTIYLTIMSALDFEEAGHKLMKIDIRDGQENEIVLMIIECCSQEKTYLNYYGLLAQRYCMLHQKWQGLFEECFRRQYALIHRLETNKLRNVAKFFAHLLHTDAISWAVLDTIRLTEDDTTSSSRIFIKILVQEVAENMGLATLNARLQDPMAAPWVSGLFPRDTPRNMRFSINFFTSIGLGALTDAMRAHLKELPRLIQEQQAKAAAAAAASGSSSSDDSDSSDDSSSDSSSSGSDSSSSDSSSSDSD
ncbi:hypothetical protein WJX73_002948 [Symbiochloris irregularis]|uniref:MI domain-containing protein n=1 Tax=Symbiochloris irregularis TaxID=706552 RepID=A0AAW1NYL2_9CHLO